MINSSTTRDGASGDLAWQRRVQAAREEHGAGGGTVLDALLRHWEGDPDELLDQLELCTGVAPANGLHEVDFQAAQWTASASRQRACVVLIGEGGARLAAAADPWSQELVQALTLAVGDVELRAATTKQLETWLLAYQAGSSDNQPRANPSQEQAAPLPAPAGSGPIVSFVDAAIRRAVDVGASDIHVECDRRGVTVQLRLDGVLQRFARMDGVANAEAVISRIKVLSQLDITERRLPQDGRMRHVDVDGSRAMDLRVSIMPSIHGEDAVLRLLDKAQFRSDSARITLDALGFDASRRELLRAIATEPSGMLLVTGPTGSGKTTTLYAVLSEINDGLEKIITIEDPVEYELEGVLQIPVNERKGLTFAKGLRSILRHDPDRILVGEIRDAETAEIAVQASLTGHQVFTTVHANGIADVVGRFLHFHLDMFGFTSALNGIVVQRLLRRLCKHCSTCRPCTSEDGLLFERHGVTAPAAVSRAIGCVHCGGTGYAGRFVVAEVLAVDDGLRDLVKDRASPAALRRHAEIAGSRSLQHAGLLHVVSGDTTLEEMRRVVGAL